MPNPTLTWEQSLTATFATQDPIAAMAALAGLITALTSGDWVVVAGGDGITDRYVEIGASATGPNPNARVLVAGNLGVPSAEPADANKGIERQPGSTTWWWCCYAPDNGRTANAWNAAGPTYTNRNTGFMSIGDINNYAWDRVKVWASEESLIVLFGTAALTQWTGFIAGATVIPTREEDGEQIGIPADRGRVRGLWCQWGALYNQFWSPTAGQFPFNMNSASTNAGGKAVVFDPAAPTTIIKVVTNLFFGSSNSTNVAVAGGEVHRAPVVVSQGTNTGPGANASPLSARGGTAYPVGHLVFGNWRQMRQGPDRVSDLAITDPPPPNKAVAYTLGSSPLTPTDTLYLDNQ